MRKIILTLNLNLVLKCWICFPWLSEPEVGQHCLWGFVILRATPIVAISTHTAGWGPSLYLPVADTNTPSEPKGTKKEISQNHCPWSSQWTAVHCHSWQSPDRGGWGFSYSAPPLLLLYCILSSFTVPHRLCETITTVQFHRYIQQWGVAKICICGTFRWNCMQIHFFDCVLHCFVVTLRIM